MLPSSSTIVTSRYLLTLLSRWPLPFTTAITVTENQRKSKCTWDPTMGCIVKKLHTTLECRSPAQLKKISYMFKLRP
ncbi:unnamed protein product [Lactuca virosa]|uniref:Uncharacterized protein n=1 Tax=Lactuca virosa TaxID=75947 RepID=A0AAU9MJV5_9ASTR|nr:unnamed protein product [Lactuca virosa]